MEPIRVEGIVEFQKALREVDSKLPRQLRIAFNEVAEDVASGARAKVRRQTGKAAKSVRARSTQRAAKVLGGGKRVPYYPWLDFGGRVGYRGAIKRSYSKDGRYIYPVYRRLRDSGKIQDKAAESLTKVAKMAGLDAKSV